MSESTSAPVADSGAAPAPTTIDAPAPNTQQSISVTEAARLLREQRRKAPDGQAPSSRPDPSARAGGTAAAAPVAPDAAPKAPSKPAGVAAMERALGVPEGAAQASPESVPGAQPTAPTDTGYEIDGVRYDHARLKALVSAGADYTAKTQALAEQNRQLQAQQQAMAQVLPFIQPELAKLQGMLEGSPMPPPDLANTDPTAYVQQLARWQAAQAEIGRLSQLQQLQQQAQQQAMAQQVDAANAALAQEYPFWADPQQRAEVQQAIVHWAVNEAGYTKDELRGLSNPRYLKTLMKAMNYDRWVQGATRTEAPASRTAATPPRGVAPPPPLSQVLQGAEDAFGQRPNIRNATALLNARRSGMRPNGA